MTGKDKNNVMKLWRVVLIVIMLCAVLPKMVDTTVSEAATKKKVSSLSITGVKTKTYTGKAVTQNIVIKDGTKVLKAGTDITIAYSNNIQVGTATVVVKGKGKYSGSVEKSFQILPRKVKLISVESNEPGKVGIDWEKCVEAQGYSIYYATEPEGNYSKLATIEKVNQFTYDTLLDEKVTYYFKVRAFVQAEGKTLYGGYSNVLSITVNDSSSEVYSVEILSEGDTAIIKLTDQTLQEEYIVDRTGSELYRAEYYWTVNIWVDGQEYFVYLGYAPEKEVGKNRPMKLTDMWCSLSCSVLKDGLRIGANDVEGKHGAIYPEVTVEGKTIIWSLKDLDMLDLSQATKIDVCNYDITRTPDYIEITLPPAQVLK